MDLKQIEKLMMAMRRYGTKRLSLKSEGVEIELEREGEAGAQHDPVRAVIGAGQQIAVPLGEIIGHPTTVRTSRASRQPDCPAGATPSGRSPGRSVAILMGM